MKIKFINAWVITNNENDDIIKNATLCVENDKIVSISEKDDANFVADEVIDVKGDVLMPGFINTHAHNAMVLFRGLNDEAPLQEWLYETNFPMEEKLTREDVYYATLFACMQSVQCGITTVVDEYFFPDAIIEATKKVGMRAFIPISIKQDYEGSKYDFLEKERKKNIDKFDDLRKEIAYCHSTYVENDVQIEETIKYARENNLISTMHVSENLEDVGQCANEHNQMSPVALLEYLGYFDNPVLIAHCVCVDKDDIEILSRYGVSVSTNPASNLKLGSGIAPVYSMLKHNVNVCIGTDGSGSNNGIDFFKDMYLTATLQKGTLNDPTILPAREILKMATINGAKALKMENVGMLKSGYQADIIRISTKSLSMTPIHNVASNIVYSASKSDLVMTMVAGKILYQNGKWTNIENVQEIIEKCQFLATDLKKRANIKEK